jgi:two-component system KDP operon response regulator KdpE
MKVLIIEDDTDIVDFITVALKIGFPGSQVIATHLGSEGLGLVESQNPDIVLLDLELPDLSGFEVLKKIRDFSQVPVIIITIRRTEADIVKGLSLGADEYLKKPFGQLELLARIRLVLKRANLDIHDTLSYRDLILDISHQKLYLGQDSVRLTPTEAIIMEAFLKSSTHAQTFDELAEVIWGINYSGSDDTIRTYIRRLRNKIKSISHDKVSIISKPGIGFALDVKS